MFLIINEILYIKSKSDKIIIQRYFANTYRNDMFTYKKLVRSKLAWQIICINTILLLITHYKI